MACTEVAHRWTIGGWRVMKVVRLKGNDKFGPEQQRETLLVLFSWLVHQMILSMADRTQSSTVVHGSQISCNSFEARRFLGVRVNVILTFVCLHLLPDSRHILT